jgi:hypothetical protein
MPAVVYATVLAAFVLGVLIGYVFRRELEIYRAAQARGGEIDLTVPGPPR